MRSHVGTHPGGTRAAWPQRPHWSASGAAEEARAPSRRALGTMRDSGFHHESSQSKQIFGLGVP